MDEAKKNNQIKFDRFFGLPNGFGTGAQDDCGKKVVDCEEIFKDVSGYVNPGVVDWEEIGDTCSELTRRSISEWKERGFKSV